MSASPTQPPPPDHRIAAGLPAPGSGDAAEILATAAQRVASEPGQPRPYAGAVTPAEAWQLSGHPGVHLIDVRSPEEYRYVGHVPGSRLVVWRGTADDQVAQFMADLRAAAPPQDAVMLLCRSSVRSVRAATAAAREGYSRAFNILEGFEGKLDDQQQRGLIDGWRRTGLPWIQE